jgi:hypothetical protein
MKLWSVSSIFVLLSKDQESREQDKLIDVLYSSPSNGTNIYEKHRILRMPFHFIPNCSRFSTKLVPYDWLHGLFGRLVRGKGSQVELRNWGSKGANRYLYSEFLHLASLCRKGDMKGYWKVCWRLMNSHAYQVSAFNYVHHGWQRTFGIKEVNSTLSEVKELCRSRSTQIKFSRRYIPKANGKLRPLGVPTGSWRVYLHMLNNLIVWHRIGREGTQHGYFPGRGVHTAWKEVLENVNKSNVYEFDLKGFFDNVDLMAISHELRDEYKYESEDVNFITALNQSIVKLCNEDRIEEPDRVLRFNRNGSINENWLGKSGSPAESLHPGLSQRDMISSMRKGMFGDLDDVNDDWILSNYETVWRKYQEYQWAVADSLSFFQSSGSNASVSLSSSPSPIPNPEGNFLKQKGVPQGAATSCSTSTLAIGLITEPDRLHSALISSATKQYLNGTINEFTMQNWCKSDYRIVMYADDGLIMSEHAFLVNEILNLFSHSGVSVNLEKSGWIKSDRKWLTNIKFLGISYDGSKDEIQASTRNGSTLKFDVYNQFLAYLLENRESILNPHAIHFEGSASHCNNLESYRGIPMKSWIYSNLFNFISSTDSKAKYLFEGKWSGYFLSSLYNNNWEQTQPCNTDLWSSSYSSWVRSQWVRYRYEKLSIFNLRENLLRLEFKKLYRDITGLKTLNFSWTDIFEYNLNEPSSLHNRLIRMARQQKISSRLCHRLNQVVEALHYLRFRPTRTPSEIRGYWATSASCLTLDIYNSSTFACDDLLNNFPLPLKATIKYSMGQTIPVFHRKEYTEYWAKHAPILLKKLIKKRFRAFRDNFF